MGNEETEPNKIANLRTVVLRENELFLRCVSSVILSLCYSLSLLFPVLVDVDVHARNVTGDVVDAVLVFADEHGVDYLCDPQTGLRLRRFVNFGRLARNGYFRIDAIRIPPLRLLSLNLLGFIGQSRYFSNGDSVEFVHEFISGLLNITRWETSDGLKWYLWTQILSARRNRN